MSSIPQDAYFEILLRVPVKSTFICKCVCKTWYSLISSNNFVRKHLDLSNQRNHFNLLVKGGELKSSCYQLYSVNYDSLLSSSTNVLEIVQLDFFQFYRNHQTQLIGTCDGLVCLWNLFFTYFYLWNPATKEYKQISKSPTKRLFSLDLFAFGYDCMLDDYKLVIIVEVNNNKEDYVVEVYTLGSDTWRTHSQTIPCRPAIGEPRGVLVNGVFHWLCETRTQDFPTVLVSLDFSGEIFKDMHLPEESLMNKHRFMSAGVLEGCLCVLVNGVETFQVWVMQDYGVPDSWTKRYTITSESIIHAPEDITKLRLIWSLPNGEFLFKYHVHRPNIRPARVFHGLVFYDPEHGSTRNPVIHGMGKLDEDLYIESLVALKSGMYVGRKTIE